MNRHRLRRSCRPESGHNHRRERENVVCTHFICTSNMMGFGLGPKAHKPSPRV
ncbi:hypothetical protein HanRHA438_Chr14g0633831 [Helianthus annuus]|nr:hypothetical protein HanRHA438_Chr14g0633831 [Helianthus annuus]